MARRAPGSWKAQAEKKICSEKRYTRTLSARRFGGR